MGNNVSIFWSNGSMTFYVRPYSKEITVDLDRLIVDAPKASNGSVTVRKKNGTYIISSSILITDQEFVESFWGMLFRRFLSESKRVCVDEKTNEKYYAVRFSKDFISPCERKLVA